MHGPFSKRSIEPNELGHAHSIIVILLPGPRDGCPNPKWHLSDENPNAVIIINAALKTLIAVRVTLVREDVEARLV